ncbi:hypothetical protein AALO_G00025020 [Alosa alosa]|uniref:Uncharacterized protein n=1 Tax=Alosa alosa TaxID=278164 RepID=A0AAV6HEI4_9TELE|nr:hypothetical protein AALO_G00025020 [Alosa alosa]
MYGRRPPGSPRGPIVQNGQGFSAVCALTYTTMKGVTPRPINSMVFTKPVPKRRVQTGEWILQRPGLAIT